MVKGLFFNVFLTAKFHREIVLLKVPMERGTLSQWDCYKRIIMLVVVVGEGEKVDEYHCSNQLIKFKVKVVPLEY